MAPPRLYRVILPVDDIVRATEFYAELFGIEGQRVSAGRHYFDCGGTILACYDPRADGDDLELGPNPEHLYFAVEDVDALHRRARFLPFRQVDESVLEQPWGERCFYAQDPFGNPLCFVDAATRFVGNEPD